MFVYTNIYFPTPPYIVRVGGGNRFNPLKTAVPFGDKLLKFLKGLMS